ncbi:TonB C-terminal domain-containing protein [Myxococcus faecalis]
MRAPSTTIDLSPRSLDSPLSTGPAPASPGSAAPPSAPEVSDMLRDGAAELQVRTGAMHAYYARLADALRAAWRARGTRARRKSGRPCTAQVRLVQAADGRVLQLSILLPSCDPPMDEELLADLRIASLPPPPPELLAGRESLRSVYRFGFHPPPRVSLEFDIVDLVDPKAIPDHEPRRVVLVRPE